jgi:hypothetical protein
MKLQLLILLAHLALCTGIVYSAAVWSWWLLVLLPVAFCCTVAALHWTAERIRPRPAARVIEEERW